jgi:hypothetical protein
MLDELISDSAHANRLSMNLPNTEEWSLFSMTIQNITSDPTIIAQRLIDKHTHDMLIQATGSQITLGNYDMYASPQVNPPVGNTCPKKFKPQGKPRQFTGQARENQGQDIHPKCQYCGISGHIEE